jgi:hypothetical protein
MLFGMEEKTVRKELKTTRFGTKMYSIEEFLKRNNITAHAVSINEDYWNIFSDLITLSLKFPVISSANYKDKFSKKGRDHAVLICDGKIYDPSQDREMSGESYEKTFSKSLIFTYLIIIDDERDGFLKAFRNQPMY